METVRELLIALGLDVDQAAFVEAIGLEHALEKAAELLVEVLKEVPKQLVEVVRETAHFADELQDASERTGLSTDSLQRLGYVAGLAGLQLGDVETAMAHLSRSMSAARDGSKEAVGLFHKLGVRATNADGSLRAVDEVMEDLAAGLQRIPKGADRSAAAMDLFGRSGRQMLNVIGGGREEFRELMGEVEDFGTVMDEEAIARGAELNKEFLRLGMIVDALKGEFAGPLIEALGPLVGELLTWVKLNRQLIGSRLVEWSRLVVAVLRRVLAVMMGLGRAVVFVVDNFKFFALVLGGIVLAALVANAGAAATAVGWYAALGIAAVVAGLKAAAAWIAAAAPVLLLAALFAALLLVVEDVYSYLTGADSLIGDLGPKWTKFLQEFLKPRAEEHWLVATFRQLGRLLTDFDSAWGAFVKDWQYAINQIWLGLPAPLRRILGGEVSAPGAAGGAAGPAIAAGAAVAAGGSIGGDMTVEEINITPHPSQSPDAIADSVVEKLEAFHSRKNREALGAGGE